MIEISHVRHLPLAHLLAFALGAIIASVIVLRLAAAHYSRRRLPLGAAAAGLLCAPASAILWSVQGAGTGTQTAWGWPRHVCRGLSIPQVGSEWHTAKNAVNPAHVFSD